MTGGAGNTEAWGRRPKASKERNRGKWDDPASAACNSTMFSLH